MKSFSTQRSSIALRLLASSVLSTLIAATPCASADSVPVRSLGGAVHGFLELRAEDGHIVASGDVTSVPHGNRITSRTVFTFKDGSIDDETTVYSQRHNLQLISDHRIQKGPYFPHPLDTLIDAHTGQVTVRTEDKDGKEDVKTDKMKLTPDLANGMVPVILENLKSDAPDLAAPLTVPIVVFSPKPRLVKLVISRIGEDKVSIAGSPRKAIHYDIKIDLGGLVGMIAPLVGKTPPDIQIWTIGGEATTFAREIGPLYAEGPMMTIQLASPSWPEESNSAK